MLENVLHFIENSYLFIAVFGTAIFVIQFIMSLIGLSSESDGADFQVEAHDIADIHGFNFFSMKAIVAFIAFFGWGGVLFGGRGVSGLVIAFGCGLLMMFITAFVIWLLLRMQQSGNLESADFIGRRGTVYLSIPGGRSGSGIVTVVLPDRTRQVQARADEAIATGSEVEVLEVIGGGFLVRKI